MQIIFFLSNDGRGFTTPREDSALDKLYYNDLIDSFIDRSDDMDELCYTIRVSKDGE